MIYQQELREVNDFFNRYKDRKIVFSQEVVKTIGLIQKDTSIKVGEQVLHGILISSSMESFVFMANLNDAQKEDFYNLGSSLKIQLKFLDPENRKLILFTLDTKFLSFSNQGLIGKGLVFIAMKIRRKIPNDLIRIFGHHHDLQEQKLREKKKKVECLVISGGRKIDCLIEHIDKGKVLLVLESDQTPIANGKSLAILKVVKTGEVVEIIGNVFSRKPGLDGSVSMTLIYQMEDQSPRFGYSLQVLKNLINN